MLGVLAGALSTPGTRPEVRAELLQMLAEVEGLTVTSGVANDLGEVGTRFTASTPDGRFEVVVDPDDGLVLETNTVAEPGAFRTSFGRPEPAGDLPPRVDAAAALLADAVNWEDVLQPSRSRFSGDTWCAMGIDSFPGAAEAGLDGMAIVHCWPIDG
jgi:hypothetical protein